MNGSITVVQCLSRVEPIDAAEIKSVFGIDDGRGGEEEEEEEEPEAEEDGWKEQWSKSNWSERRRTRKTR